MKYMQYMKYSLNSIVAGFIINRNLWKKNDRSSIMMKKTLIFVELFKIIIIFQTFQIE